MRCASKLKLSRWLDARLRASRELPAGEIAESWREEEENEENDDDDDTGLRRPRRA